MNATVSLRISRHIWMHDNRRAEVLDLVRQHRDTIDEVCFFTSFTHSVLPYDETARRATQLKAIIPEFKALGLRTGINHLCTFGHLDEDLDHALQEPWQRTTDINGTTARGSFCPLDPHFQDFTRRCYRELAAAAPDFIWIDDDIRMNHHPPARFACFCDLCLARFSEETGQTWTREHALRFIHQDGPEASRNLRTQWVAHNRRILNEVFALIRTAVDDVNPAIPLGYMPTNQLYEGMDYAEWNRILAGERSLPVKWRPGGGFYRDARPLEALQKAHYMGRSAEAVPAGESDIQYEHENFPYQKLHKSETIFVAESAIALAAGCTGVALNPMGISPDPLGEYLPYFDRIREAKPFFDRLVALAGRSPCEGIWAAYSPDRTWAAGLKDGSADPMPCLTELAEIGLPPAYSRRGTKIHLLSGNAVHAFSREELTGMLAEAVLLDGPALQALAELDMADLAGFAVTGTRDHDTIERFTADVLNGGYAGWSRDCRPSFWRTNAYILKATNDHSRVLAELIDFQQECYGAVMGICENRLGGRVAVMGYYPWASLQNLAKSSQLKTLCRWLSRDSLPAYVDSFHKLALWCRRDAAGRMVIPLLNASLDTITNVRLAVVENRSYRLLRLNGQESAVTITTTAGPYSMLALPPLAPWETALLV